MAQEDELVLKVGSKTPVAELASAVSHGVYASRQVVLRAVGAGAINQSVKAFIVARGFAAARGLDLVVVPGFCTIKMADGDVTGVTFRVLVL